MNINIPGIDVEKAIQHAGSEELFLELLHDLYHLMDEKISLVESALLQKDLTNYTVYVHSLKTTCRMLGDSELGEAFYALELLGKENDLAQIEKRTPDVLDSFRALKPYLAPFAVRGSDGPLPFDRDRVRDLLHKLMEAIADYDLTNAEETTRMLSSFSLTPALSDKVRELQRLVANLDYDEANALSLDILDILDHPDCLHNP